MISSQMLVSVLDLWCFNKNKSRQNVMPESSEFVFSDTFGLVSSRNGRAVITSATKQFSFFFALLCRYLDDHLPDNLKQFAFSSISLNFDYAAAPQGFQ